MRSWTVDDVMTTDVVAVREDTCYREIVDMLAERAISAVPVVDVDWRVVGVVSEADLLHKIEFTGDGMERRIFASRRRRQAEAKADGLLARELMSAPPITVMPGTSLTVAAKLMDHERVKRLPVVDALGRLAGIVTRSDLLRVYLRADHEIADDVGHEVLERMLLTEPGRVTVRVRGGVVTMTGRVDRFSTARLAVKLARSVPGVVGVIDRLGFDFDDRKLAEASQFRPGPFGMP
jgi:CBS domain-containing protein